MFDVVLQKNATSELWWIGSALALFLTALLVVSGYKYVKSKRTGMSQGGTEGEEERPQSDAPVPKA